MSNYVRKLLALHIGKGICALKALSLSVAQAAEVVNGCTALRENLPQCLVRIRDFSKAVL